MTTDNFIKSLQNTDSLWWNRKPQVLLGCPSYGTRNKSDAKHLHERSERAVHGCVVEFKLPNGRVQEMITEADGRKGTERDDAIHNTPTVSPVIPDK